MKKQHLTHLSGRITKERHRGDSFLIGKYFRYEPLEDARTPSHSLTDGYQILEEKGYQFVLIKYFVCDCHFISTFEKKEGCYHLNDLVDGNAFVRFYLNKCI